MPLPRDTRARALKALDYMYMYLGGTVLSGTFPRLLAKPASLLVDNRR